MRLTPLKTHVKATISDQKLSIRLKKDFICKVYNHVVSVLFQKALSSSAAASLKFHMESKC